MPHQGTATASAPVRSVPFPNYGMPTIIELMEVADYEAIPPALRPASIPDETGRKRFVFVTVEDLPAGS